MNFILAILGGAIGAVLGFVAAGFLSYAIARGMGMSDINGGLAMTTAFVIGPFGAIAGLIAGV